jgi:hypothetical protein
MYELVLERKSIKCCDAARHHLRNDNMFLVGAEIRNTLLEKLRDPPKTSPPSVRAFSPYRSRTVPPSGGLPCQPRSAKPRGYDTAATTAALMRRDGQAPKTSTIMLGLFLPKQ